MRISPLWAGLIVAVQVAAGGTNGTLEGTVHDMATGEALPGANILIVQLGTGGSSDVEGRFIIANVRAGRYDVRVTLVGYRPQLLKGIVINPDLRTRLTVNLAPTAVEMPEMVIVQERPLIQRDVTATTYAVVTEEAIPLPVDNVLDAVYTKAGVTREGNIRGGKTTEVLFLVDGLPVQDVLAGGSTARLPNSSITGLSMYTGGFDAEYGNALSGVINLITRTGGDDHRVAVRADSDHLFGGTQHSYMTDVEVSISGPLASHTLYYLASVNGVFTDTPWWQDLQNFYTGPIEKTWTGFGKLDYYLSPEARLGAQLLITTRTGHPYEFDWRYNLDGLPPEQRTAYRAAAILSHTPSRVFSYTASMSVYSLSNEINDAEPAAVAQQPPYQYDFFLRYIVDGNRAWWTRTGQISATAKFDGTARAGEVTQIRFGGEGTFYRLTSEIVKFEPRRTYFGKPLVNEPQLDYSSSYTYEPRSGSAYVQAKVDVPSEGALVNFGLRYDFLNPRAERPRIEAIPLADTAYALTVEETVPASFKHYVSPRIGAAMQVAERGYLYVNLGWYVQFPLFDYLYTGVDRVSLAKGISAITGNPDLDPEQTKMWEISLKYILPLDIVVSGTYFRKESSNLVDTKTYVPGDSKVAGSYGFAEYVNTPYGEFTGFELVVMREQGAWLTGEFSYTYMVAEGTSGSAQDGFYIAQFGLPPATRVYPLSWDQRHTLKLVATLALPTATRLSTIAEYHTGRPYTRYPSSTGFEPVDQEQFEQNNARMSDFSNVDLKVEQQFHLGFWPAASWTVYVDIRNVLNRMNVLWVDSNGRVGGELNDPTAYSTGRRTSVGFRLEW